MNMPNELEKLRAELAKLPEESPPPSVWLELQLAHAELFPKAKVVRRWPYAAVAAVLMLALVPLLLMRPTPAPIDLRLPEERAAALRILDRELQLRYIDGASDAELAPLWRQREELLRRTTHPDLAAEPIRI